MKQTKAEDLNIFRKLIPNLSRVFILFGISTFFIALADAVMSYFVPVIITNSGLSNSQMGLIYGSSSIFGAIFDFVLSKYLKSTNYKRMYIYAILLAMLFPILMFATNWFFFYLVAMMLWALYYNIWTFGFYDFVAREEKSHNHAVSFGYLTVFNDIGYIIGPILAAQLIISEGSILPGLTPMIALLFALFFIIGIILLSNYKERKRKVGNEHKEGVEEANKNQQNERNITFFTEANLWLKVGRKMWPILILALFLNVLEAIFWVVFPIMEDLGSNVQHLGGILMAVSLAPSLFITWLIGPVTTQFGKKRTAFISFLLANIILLAVGFVSNVYIVIILIFVSNLFQAMAFPAVAGAVADYLKESKSYHNEILSVKDFFGNIGFVIGPVLAGFLLDNIGGLMILSYFSIGGIIISIFLLLFSPRSIDFHDRSVK